MTGTPLSYTEKNALKASDSEILVEPERRVDTVLLDQASFEKALHLEQKRAERSQANFVLLLMKFGDLLLADEAEGTLGKIVNALSISTRETDTKGWFEELSAVGIIFTELGTSTGNDAANTLLVKMRETLAGSLTASQIGGIALSHHVFPHDWQKGALGATGSTLCLDFAHKSGRKHWGIRAKKFVDIAGSLFALALFSPILVAISIVVKLTSKGPILFRQERLGQYEHPFTFLKFRSMYTQNDPAIHQEYVKRLIAGEAGTEQAAGKQTAYKLTNDPRVTPIGRFLRRTSLDELPQFLNVLRGEMSLVGPRPPISYEVNHYNTWHRRRLQVKPGITGLWQVKGRSRTTFDEMVRLDLEYARSWSLWLDIKIILQTPRAMFFGDGAY